MKNIRYFILIISVILSLSGCNNAVEPPVAEFNGKDNYITVFSLTKDNETYMAQITHDNRILLDIPENISLDGAVADITISENATISPLPESITDWEDIIIFRVTSFDQTEREYRYILTKSECDKQEGNVTLSTQAEVDAFAQSGIKIITGTLSIGTNSEVSASDSIVSLEALNSIEEVRGSIIVNSTYKSDTFCLDNLKALGGNLIVKINTVKTLRMPALESIQGSLEYYSECDRSLTFDSHTIEFPKLKEIWQNLDLSITRTTSTVQEDTQISFPSLTMIYGKLSIKRDLQIANLRFPSLETIGSLEWTGCTGSDENIHSLSFDALEQVNGDFIMKDADKLGELHAPKLKNVAGAFRIKVPNGILMKKLDFSSLVSIKGDCEITGINHDFSGFQALEKIGGNFTYSAGRNSSEITVPFKGLENLKYVYGDKIALTNQYMKDVSGLQNITTPIPVLSISATSSEISNIETLRNLQISELYLYFSNNEQTIDIRGFHFDKLLLRSDLNGTVENNPTIIMDREVSGDCLFEGYLTIEGLTKLTGTISYSEQYYVRHLEFPDLQEIEGDFSYAYYASSPGLFPKLRKIKGNLTGSITPINLDTEPLPALEEIEGNIDLKINLTDLRFPSLKKVSGELKLTRNSTWSNNSIATMDGFSALESAGKINISGCPKLISYAGLAKAINNMTDPSQWTVSQNGYNPSYKDVKSGKLIMEEFL